MTLYSMTMNLFAPRGTITRPTARSLLQLAFATGVTFEREPGAAGRFWIDDWKEHFAEGAESALESVDKASMWTIDLWAQTLDGTREPVSLMVVRDSDLGPHPRLAPFELVAVIADWKHVQATRRSWCQQLLSLTLAISHLIQPVYGWGGSNIGLRAAEPRPVRGSALARGRPQDLEWFNLFGSAYVELMGRERLLSVPVWRRDLLLGGAVALTLAPDFESVDLQEARRLASDLGVPAP